MALSQPMQLVDNFQRNIGFDAVYIKVARVSGDKTAVTAAVELKDGAEGPVLESSNMVFPLDLDGLNPIKQACLHLKTLPEFADAVDC